MPPRALGPIHPMQTSTAPIHSPFKSPTMTTTQKHRSSHSVNGVDDIVADSFSLNEDGSLSYNVLNNDSFEAAHPQLQPLAHHPMAPSPSTATAPLARSHTHQLQTSTALTPSPTPSHPAVSLKQPPSTSPSTNRTTQAPSPVTPTVQVMRTAAITGTLNFTDTTDGDSNPNFTVNTGPSNGTATINATTGAWSYSPNADFNGSGFIHRSSHRR